MSLRRSKTPTLLALASFCVGAAAFAQQAAPLDAKLRGAYQRIRFERMYPPEAATSIQQRLQDEERALDGMAELLKDPRPDIRALTAVLAGEYGDADGANILWPVIQDDVEFVRVTAAGALVRLSQLTSIAGSWSGLTDPRPQVRQLTAATLVQLRDKSAESALLDAIRDENELVRTDVVTALGTCGTRNAVPALIEALHDDSVLVRQNAAAGLGVLGDASVMPDLLDALKDPDWHVRAMAIRALSLIAGSHPDRVALIIDPIEDRLRNDDFALVRDRAADALARPGDEKAIAALVSAMISDNRGAIFHAHESLIRSKAVSALPQLAEHLQHPDPEVRKRIIRVFGEIGGSDQIPAVVDALSDPDSSVRYTAAAGLSKMKERGAAEKLKEKTSDPDANVRAAVARALGELSDTSALPKLVELLRDPNGFVRSAAAEALGKLGDRSATTALIQVLTGEQLPSPTIGSEELVIGSDAAPLPEMAKQKLIEEKTKAVQALGAIRDPQAVDSVIQYGLKGDDAGLRAESAITLGKIGEVRAVEPLQDAVRPYYEAVPQDDTEGIISVGPMDERMRQMKEREARVRSSVAWALGKLGDPSARQILIRAANDENSLVRDAAIEALAKISEKEEKLAASGTGAKR